MSRDADDARAEQIARFKERVFSGHDLLHLMDLGEIGVGATILLVEMAERSPHQRPLTFDADLTVADVHEALLAMMAAKPQHVRPRKIVG